MENYITIKKNSDESLSSLWKGTHDNIKYSGESMNVYVSTWMLVY